jgi:hypothetical protein
VFEKLPKSVHDAYHAGLDKVLPRQLLGGAVEHYRTLSPQQQAESFEKLMNYTIEFDKKYGTQLWEALKRVASGAE